MSESTRALSSGEWSSTSTISIGVTGRWRAIDARQRTVYDNWPWRGMTTETTGCRNDRKSKLLQERGDVLFIKDRQRDKGTGRLRDGALPSLVARRAAEEPAGHSEPEVLDGPSMMAGDGQALVEAPEDVLGAHGRLMFGAASPAPGARAAPSLTGPVLASWARRMGRERLANDRSSVRRRHAGRVIVPYGVCKTCGPAGLQSGRRGPEGARSRDAS